jgi:uncharacterized coiled-coil protein SlyX
MDSNEEFKIPPLPLEMEFRVMSIRRRLHELDREEIEEFLTEALAIMAKLAHQLRLLSSYVEELEGKNNR